MFFFYFSLAHFIVQVIFPFETCKQKNPWREEKSTGGTVNSIGSASEHKTRELASIKLNVERKNKTIMKHYRKRCPPTVMGNKSTSKLKIERETNQD